MTTETLNIIGLCFIFAWYDNMRAIIDIQNEIKLLEELIKCLRKL